MAKTSLSWLALGGGCNCHATFLKIRVSAFPIVLHSHKESHTVIKAKWMFICLSVCEFCSYWDDDASKNPSYAKQQFCDSTMAEMIVICHMSNS